jgi:hypothetical protein
LRLTGPEIAATLSMPLSTVSGILTRIGLGRLGRLGLEPAERDERQRPGELIHVDIKKLGRITLPGHRVTTVERVITDNGPGYRSAIHALACRALGIRHLRTRPYRRRPTAKPNA